MSTLVPVHPAIPQIQADAEVRVRELSAGGLDRVLLPEPVAEDPTARDRALFPIEHAIRGLEDAALEALQGTFRQHGGDLRTGPKTRRARQAVHQAAE